MAGGDRRDDGGYRRPAIVETVWRDADGAPIRYGERWGSVTTPDEAYSRTSNLERFAPLHEIADALIAWLVATFDATADPDPAVGDDLMDPPGEIVRAVRVTPSDPLAAPLTFVASGFPGVVVHAGLLHDHPAPWCGCDACDESFTATADDLERLVFRVVGGRFEERVDAGRDGPTVTGTWFAEDGRREESASTGLHEHHAERVRAAAAALAGGRRWAPWPLRTSSRAPGPASRHPAG